MVRAGIVKMILRVVNKGEVEHPEVDIHGKDDRIQIKKTESEEKVSDSISKVTTEGSD